MILYGAWQKDRVTMRYQYREFHELGAVFVSIY